MIDIPKQLKQKGVRFVLLKKEAKKPFQEGWQKKNIQYEDYELLNHLNSDGNYGVMGGGEKKLIMVDFDNKEVQEEVIKKLPPTFTVKTGSGLLHLYYFSDKCESFKIFEADMKTIADIQGEGKQVVGAGSKHPNGNLYELVNDTEISYIDYAELRAVLMPYDKKVKKNNAQEIQKNYSEKFEGDNNFLDEVKSKITMQEVLSAIGIDTGYNPTQCPFHDSAGGKCLGFERDVAHCFHCDDSWNIFSLMKQYKNCDFKEALEELAKMAGLSDQLEASRKKYKEDNNPFSDAAQIFNRKTQGEQFSKTQPLFYDKTGCFWLWDEKGKRWDIVDDIDILNMIQDTTGQDTISSKNRTEILNALKQVGRRNIPEDIKPTWIQFKDKIMDVMTGETFEATPEYFVTNPIPWELSDSEETPTIDKLFTEWVGEEDKQLLYEIIAYCLLPDYPIHRLFCFVGAGLNGKSCYLNLIKRFVGDANCTSTELDTLMTSRFEITKLHKKLVCQMGETDFNELNRTAILKKLTGQDSIGFEYKNKTPFDDINYAKILISTNNLPTTSDKTIGFYRRWAIIDFPNQFNESKDVLGDIPEQEYSNLARKSIRILGELIQRRSFTNEGSIEDRQKKYEDRSNPMEKFFKEMITEDFSAFVTKNQFKIQLDKWLVANKFREMTSQAINKFMKDKGFEMNDKDRVEWFDNDQPVSKMARSWRGIKLL